MMKVASQLRAAGRDQLTRDELMAKPKPLPSRDLVIKHLHYEADTGLFYRQRVMRGGRKGRPAGSKTYDYYTGEPKAIRIAIGCVPFMAHRLAWLIMTGDDPGPLTVDHVNRQPFDNRFCNLRLADHSLQMRNRDGYGASSCKGISYCPYHNKWRARSSFDTGKIHLGYFDSEEAAAAAAAPYYL